MADKKAAPGAAGKGGHEVPNVPESEVWKDVVRAELKAADKAQPGSFTLNPKKLAPVTGKIGYEPPPENPAETLRRTQVKLELQSTIEDAAKTPRQKQQRPRTTNQEVGWFVQEEGTWKETSDLTTTHKSAPETRYFADYITTFKAGPFDKTQPIARM